MPGTALHTLTVEIIGRVSAIFSNEEISGTAAMDCGIGAIPAVPAVMKQAKAPFTAAANHAKSPSG